MPPTSPTVLIDQDELSARIAALAQEIRHDLPAGQIHLICVLKGAFLFLGDLIRAMPGHVTIDFMACSSYGGGTSSSGEVRLSKDLDVGIEGRDVIIVEDIVDTGLTLHYLLAELGRRSPRSLEACTLLDRTTRRIIPTPVRYRGFEIGDEFVLGYGLDFSQRYRNLDRVVLGDVDVLREDPDAYVPSLYRR